MAALRDRYSKRHGKGHANRPRRHHAIGLDVRPRRVRLPSSWRQPHANASPDANTSPDAITQAQPDARAQAQPDARAQALIPKLSNGANVMPAAVCRAERQVLSRPMTLQSVPASCASCGAPRCEKRCGDPSHSKVLRAKNSRDAGSVSRKLWSARASSRRFGSTTVAMIPWFRFA